MKNETKFCQSCGMPLNDEMPHADRPMKKVFVDEVNAMLKRR